MSVKTPADVRAELERNGISIAQWAVAHGLNTNLVYEVLRGQRKCVRGESHRVAVMLGMKEGSIKKAEDVHLALRKVAA